MFETPQPARNDTRDFSAGLDALNRSEPVAIDLELLSAEKHGVVYSHSSTASTYLKDPAISGLLLQDPPSVLEHREDINTLVQNAHLSDGLYKFSANIHSPSEWPVLTETLAADLQLTQHSCFHPAVVSAASVLADAISEAGQKFMQITDNGPMLVYISIWDKAFLEDIKVEAAIALHIHPVDKIFAVYSPIHDGSTFATRDNIDPLRHYEFFQAKPDKSELKLPLPAYLQRWEENLGSKLDDAYYLQNPEQVIATPPGSFVFGKGKPWPQPHEVSKQYFESHPALPHGTPRMETGERRLLAYFEPLDDK